MNYLDYLAQRSLSYERYMEKLFKEGIGFIPNNGVTCRPEDNYTTYLKQRSVAYERLLSELQASLISDNTDKKQGNFSPFGADSIYSDFFGSDCPPPTLVSKRQKNNKDEEQDIFASDNE